MYNHKNEQGLCEKMKMVRRAAAFSLLPLHLRPLCLLLLYLVGNHQQLATGAKEYNRHHFPPGFIFGSGTSAYQVEGAAFKDGRKASIFDTFARGFLPGNGDVAADEYHRYKEDVQHMVETGLDAYRFSISWSRLIPDGRGHVNPKGLKYYNDLINELISNGIQPHVTLMHLDVPQALEDEYGGFLNRKIVEDFTAYADVCFREFGDRVLYWTPINEANIFVIGGYNNGNGPPGRCSFPFGFVECAVGNSTTEPYIVAHNALLAHASAARLYKEKYQAKQHGSLGFSVYAFHFIPFMNRIGDVIASQRAHEFIIGWFMHPLIYGDYPKIMKKNVGTKLPSFTKDESELVKGSFDFIGLNYYTVVMTKDNSTCLMNELRDFNCDMAVTLITINGSAPFGQNPYPNIPSGLQGVLKLFKQLYGNPPIYIYENGEFTEQNTLDDGPRVEYLQGHIGGVLDAVRNGSNTKGYFAWSFVDLFELLYGNKSSFGLYYINFNDPNLTRSPKSSQRWYSGFLKGENVVTDGELEEIPTIFQNSLAGVNDLSLIQHSELLQHKSSWR